MSAHDSPSMTEENVGPVPAETASSNTRAPQTTTGPKPLDVLPNTPSPHRRRNIKRLLLTIAAVVIVATIAVSVFMIIRSNKQANDAVGNQTTSRP